MTPHNTVRSRLRRAYRQQSSRLAHVVRRAATFFVYRNADAHALPRRWLIAAGYDAALTHMPRCSAGGALPTLDAT